MLVYCVTAAAAWKSFRSVQISMAANERGAIVLVVMMTVTIWAFQCGRSGLFFLFPIHLNSILIYFVRLLVGVHLPRSTVPQSLQLIHATPHFTYSGVLK